VTPAGWSCAYDSYTIDRMAKTYLTTTYNERADAKALGARWDPAESKWFVPDGLDLAPFSVWLPATLRPAGASSEVVPRPNVGSELAVSGKKGISLSQLLGGVSQAVALAYKSGVWVLVEVVELRSNGGHIFMGVSERDSKGTVLAKTSAVIWQSTANTILPEFARATGAQLAPGIKLLVRARPVFKAEHGFSLEVDAIDLEYTLGDLEARKREIRERLLAEGVFAANKQLTAPWDFNAVLVVAPAGGAGLGDFQAEANRLETGGICQFVYAYSRFQGEGAAREICDAMQLALAAWDFATAGLPDAVVIIRGGGAVNDLAWLNDYDLARYVCDLQIPVLTGIGHERDNTVLDAVAHLKFDTPSKVIVGIEQTIVQRTRQAQGDFDQIANLAARAILTAKGATVDVDVAVRNEARRHLAQGKQLTAELLVDVRLSAVQGLRSCAEQSREKLQLVKTEAVAQLASANQNVPNYWNEVSFGTRHAIRAARTEGDALIGGVLERGRRDVVHATRGAWQSLDEVSVLARQIVQDGALRSEALMREIAGQGPEKTLNRGFAIVRTQDGLPITRAAQAVDGSDIAIQFQDGHVAARTNNHN
jgi:exodeoxyribonuclease VII large subunit